MGRHLTAEESFDATIFEETDFRAQTLIERLREMAFLSRGLEITFRDERVDPVLEQNFKFNGGITDFVRHLNASKEPLFKRVVDIPGFATGSYIAFLTPGIVVMTALFSSGWAGMGFIIDMERGVLNRFLVTPAPRGSLIAGNLGYLALTSAIQSLIIIGLGFAAVLSSLVASGGTRSTALSFAFVLHAANFLPVTLTGALAAWATLSRPRVGTNAGSATAR